MTVIVKTFPGMDCTIRPARPEDAEAISNVIVSALRETNSRDYTREIIERVGRSFSPQAIMTLMGERQMFVASLDGHIVGTASLDGRAVRTMFVRPEYHGRGIGRQLMAQVEQTALNARASTLTVPSSVTAEAFYAKLGYRAVRDEFYGDERTIIMERALDVSQ